MTTLLVIGLCILSCVGLVVREIKRRRMRKSHRVYVEDAKAKDDAAREAESDADRAQREEMVRRLLSLLCDVCVLFRAPFERRCDCCCDLYHLSQDDTVITQFLLTFYLRFASIFVRSIAGAD